MSYKIYEKIVDGIPIKIGRYYEGYPDRYPYRFVKFDINGWADSSKFLPADFDICFCQIMGRDKPIPAWHSGFGWDGYRFKPEYQVLKWKLNYDC